ncbi:MAG TPA: phage terminase large subunit, partial [Candidatus Binataceae bacterium]|nr:phage terminase large subunit [Candidatus Binataceae bacterium]
LVRERLDFPALKARVEGKASFWSPDCVLIEDTSNGIPLIQTLKAETNLPLLPVKPLGSKESRASAVSPLFESGRVFLPQSAPWLADYVDELLSFPAGHDDQIDATSQGLTWLRGERREYAYTPAPYARLSNQESFDHGIPRVGGSGITDRLSMNVDFHEIARREDGESATSVTRRTRWGKWWQY